MGGKFYFLMFNTTSNLREECFCGSLYQGEQKAERDCNMPCKGNISLVCGAGRRNSVYLTGLQYDPKGELTLINVLTSPSFPLKHLLQLVKSGKITTTAKVNATGISIVRVPQGLTNML